MLREFNNINSEHDCALYDCGRNFRRDLRTYHPVLAIHFNSHSDSLCRE